MSIEIVFEEQPKRRYLLNGEQVPSVTTVLNCLSKDGLPWWGMKVGVEGVCELIENRTSSLPWNQPDAVVSMLTKHNLTVNHKRDEGATRGKSVHDALELWARNKTVPRLAEFPDEDRGYVQGLASFLMDEEPEFLETEVIVGSAEHRFAGRYDVKARMRGQVVRLDAKTQKKGRVYDQAHFQLAGYDLAAREMGETPEVETSFVLALASDGSYTLEEIEATHDDFLAVLSCYRALGELREARKRARKEDKQRLAA